MLLVVLLVVPVTPGPAVVLHVPSIKQNESEAQSFVRGVVEAHWQAAPLIAVVSLFVHAVVPVPPGPAVVLGS